MVMVLKIMADSFYEDWSSTCHQDRRQTVVIADGLPEGYSDNSSSLRGFSSYDSRLPTIAESNTYLPK